MGPSWRGTAVPRPRGSSTCGSIGRTPSCGRSSTPIRPEAVVQLGTVPVAPFALPGTEAVAESVVPFCHGGYRAALLEYHGAVTWGDTMQQAYDRMETVEQVAQVTLHLRTLGCDRVMPDALVAQLEGLRPKWGVR